MAIVEGRSPTFETVWRRLIGCIYFFKCGIKTKTHFEWLLWHWSSLGQLNLEPTRPLQSANWPREDQCQRSHAHGFSLYYPMQLPTFCDEMSNISRVNIWSWLKSLLAKELTQLQKSQQTPFTFHWLCISISLHQGVFVRQNLTVKLNWVVSSWHQPRITTLATVAQEGHVYVLYGWTIHITRIHVLLGRLWVWIDIYQCLVPYWNMPLYFVLTTTIVYRPDMCRHVLSHNK